MPVTARAETASPRKTIYHDGACRGEPQAGQPLHDPWAVGECMDATGDSWRVQRGLRAGGCRISRPGPRLLRIEGDFPAGLARFDLIGRDDGFDVDSLYLTCRFTPGTGSNPHDPTAPRTGPWDYINDDFVVPRFALRVNGEMYPEFVWAGLPGIDDLARRRIQAGFAVLVPSSGPQCVELDFNLPNPDDRRLDARTFIRIEIGPDEREGNRAAPPPPLLEHLEGVHPRLWVTPACIERLRGEIRAGGVRHAAWHKVWCKTHVDPLAHALRFLLEDNREALQVAVADGGHMVSCPHWGGERPGHMGCDNDIQAGSWLFRLALLLDWLGEAIDAERRARWREGLINHARVMYRFALLQRGYLPTGYLQNHFSGAYHGLGAAGLLLCDDANAGLAAEARRWLSLVTYEFERRNALFAVDGSGQALDVSYGMRFFGLFAEALRTATGRSLLRGSFIENLWRYWRHSRLAQGGAGGYRGTLWQVARETENAEALDWLRAQAHAAHGLSVEEFLWHLPGEGRAELPFEPLATFAEAGEVYAHTSDGATALFFAGVPAGRSRQPQLTRYNHAHFTPTQGEIKFWYRDEPVFDIAGRSYRKLTAHGNTLTVDGAGQYGDGFVWMPQLQADRCGALLYAYPVLGGRTIRAAAQLAAAYPHELGIASYRREMWLHLGDVSLLAIVDRVRLREDAPPRNLEWHFHNRHIQARNESPLVPCVTLGEGPNAFELARHASQPDAWRMTVNDSPIVVQYTHKGDLHRHVTWSRAAAPGETVVVAYLLQSVGTRERAVMGWVDGATPSVSWRGQTWALSEEITVRSL